MCIFSLAVTIARAIELKHNASLISALAHETAQMYTTAGNEIFDYEFNILVYSGILYVDV